MEDDTMDGCVVSKVPIDNDEIEVVDEVPSSSQPATQPLGGNRDTTDSEEEEGSSTEEEEIWGVLYPMKYSLRIVELTSDMKMITIGRATSNKVVITPEQMPEEQHLKLSKLQFIIEKRSDGVVEIKDTSTNGTSLDERKIGKNKRAILKHNSTIVMAEMPSFVFMYTKNEYQLEFPEPLRRIYMISKKLGSGACGVVHLAFRRSDGKKFAIKCIEKKKFRQLGKPDLLMKEVTLTQKAEHPNIIKIYDLSDTPDTLYLVLEYAAGGELFDKIVEDTRFSESVSKMYFLQILSAVKYLHSINIAHRDLKPENVLVGEQLEELTSGIVNEKEAKHYRVIKVADFGLSKEKTAETELKSFVGTPQYIAPEIIVSRVRPDKAYDVKSDMWSLGVILYILLSGTQPFRPDRSDKKELVVQICNCDYDMSGGIWNEVSEDAKDLIKNLLVYSPDKRLSAEQAMKHPWLDDADIKEKVRKIMESEKAEQATLKRPHSSSSETGEIEISNENKALNGRPFKRQK